MSKTVGQVIRHLRRNAGMSQRDLSWQSGVDINTIKMYEMDECAPNVLTLEPIAKAVGTTARAITDECGVLLNETPAFPKREHPISPSMEIDLIAIARNKMKQSLDLANERESQLAPYREELEAATRALREKYDCDDIEADVRTLRETVAELESEITHRALRLIPTIALELFSAGDATMEDDLVKWFDARNVLIRVDQPPTDETVVAQLRTLVAEIDTYGVDYVNATNAKDLKAYGFRELQSKNDAAHRVRHPISVSIHVDTIAGIGELNTAVRAKMLEVEREVAKTAEQRRRALYEELRREFDPEDEKQGENAT